MENPLGALRKEYVYPPEPPVTVTGTLTLFVVATLTVNVPVTDKEAFIG
jgi:hypothetical protein